MAGLELLNKVFDKATRQRKSILLIGRYGIGKSSVVYQYAERKARELGRELKIWHELSEEEKKEVINNPEKYFVLVDIKGSMISPENLIMPFFNDSEVIWKVPLWVKVFEKPESAGVLFIDEINMTPPSLQSILFELILQRKIAETSLKSKNLLVIGAGNDLESNEYANEIPKPLVNRFLIINFDELISLDSFVKYAINKKLDERVINYVLFKNALFTKANESLKQSTTPRSLEMLSDMIKDENDLEYIEFVAKALLEEHDAIEFIAFIELYEKLKDLEQYVKDTNKLEQLKEDELYVVTMKLTQRYLENKLKTEDIIKVLEKVCEIRKEFVVTAMKFIKISNNEKFIELIDNISEDSKLLKLTDDLLDFM